MPIRFDFTVIPQRPASARCAVCPEPIETWYVRATLHEQPASVVCATCARSIFDAVLGSDEAIESIPARQRNEIGRHLRASATRDFVRAFESARPAAR